MPGQRIAFFTTEFPPYPGGIATYTWELAAAAKALGHEPVVHAIGAAGTMDAPADFEIRQTAAPDYTHRQLPMLHYWVRRALRADRFDTLFACDYKLVMAMGPIGRRAAKIAAVHGTDVKGRILTALADARLYRPMRMFGRIAANSIFTRRELLKHHPYLRPEEVVVAYLGVDQFWRGAPQDTARAALRDRLGLDEGRRTFLSIGRIERRKGQDQAIRAIQRLPDSVRAKVTYLIVGRVVEEDYAAELRALIAESKADIRLVGTLGRDELLALCHQAESLLHTATVIPRRAEGFGLVIAEAAACGLPTIGTAIDAIPEVIADGESGILVADGDIAAITDAICRVLSDDGLRAKLGQGALVRSRQFEWRSTAALTFGLP